MQMEFCRLLHQRFFLVCMSLFIANDKAVYQVFLRGSLETSTISEITQALINHITTIYTYIQVPLICLKFQKILHSPALRM